MGGSGTWRTAAASPRGATSFGAPGCERGWLRRLRLLRRRPGPAGPGGNHVAPLSLSVWHIEDRRAGPNPRVQSAAAGAVHAPLPHLGQLGSAPLAAVGRAAAAAVNADHSGRAGDPTESRLHPGGSGRVHRAAGPATGRAGLARGGQRPASASAWWAALYPGMNVIPGPPWHPVLAR